MPVWSGGSANFKHVLYARNGSQNSNDTTGYVYYEGSTSGIIADKLPSTKVTISYSNIRDVLWESGANVRKRFYIYANGKYLKDATSIPSNNSSEELNLSGYDLYRILNNSISIKADGSAVVGSYPSDLSDDIWEASGNVRFSSVSILVPSCSVSNVNSEDNKVEQETRISWNSTNQTHYTVNIYNSSGSVVKTYNATSTSTSIVIPANELAHGTYTVKVKVKHRPEWMSTDAYSTSSSEVSGTFNKIGSAATISNLELNQNNIDIPMILSWRSTLQSKIEIEAYQNNVKIKTYSETTTSSNKTVPIGDIKSIGSTSFRIRVANTIGSDDLWSDWIERNFTLTRTVPRITNFNVLDNFWEKDIRSNWRGENQSKFEFEILKDNVRFKLFTGNTDNNFTIPKNTFTSSGDYTFRVRPIFVPIWSTTDVSYGEWVEKNVKLIDIIPTISNLSLSGSNIDLTLVLSFDSTDQDKVELEVWKDATRVVSKSGTTEKSFSFVHSTLTTGLHKFKVRVAYSGSNGYKWTEWQETNVTLSETLPSIGVFEPDGIIIDRDNTTRIWWTSNNQTKWKIVLDESTTYEGTTQTECVLSAGTLQTGKHKIVLTVTYITPNNIEKYTTKKAEFIVQGKPPIPTITSGDFYTINRPTITWDTQDQQGYILDVLSGSNVVWTTEWQNGLVTRQKVLSYLPNGTYTIRIKIINQFSMESDYSVKAITVDSNESTPINLSSYKLENCIRLVWNNISDRFSEFYIIRNNIVIAKMVDTEYTDYTCNGEVMYTIRGVVNDVYNDSNVVSENILIPYGIVASINKLDDMMNVGISRNKYSFDGNIQLEHELIYLTGRENPISVFGEHTTGSYSFKFTTKDSLFRFLEMCKRRSVFCFRDKRHTLYLTIPNLGYNIDMFGIGYSLQANQVDYSEVMEYD